MPCRLFPVSSRFFLALSASLAPFVKYVVFRLLGLVVDQDPLLF